ncbi:MAG: SMI1/KNR4 family protein [Pseudomonadota bacterium]
MKIDISGIKGLVFTLPASGEEYGTIREYDLDFYPDGFPVDTWMPFADDDCGNIFAVSADGKIAWWDHETDEITVLSDSFEEFCMNCGSGEDVEDGQVISTWVNPDFKPEFD